MRLRSLQVGVYLNAAPVELNTGRAQVHSVRGPKYVVKKGKTSVWSREDAKTLLDSIPKDSVSGLRDLALIAAMFYSFARVSAVLKLRVDDYYHNGARRRLRLHEKGGKEHEMPVHHVLEEILNEYIVAAGLQSGQPLFQSLNSLGTAVTGRALNRYNAWAAIRKRAKAAGFLTPVGCHTWRATGITIYLENERYPNMSLNITSRLHQAAECAFCVRRPGVNQDAASELILRRAQINSLSQRRRQISTFQGNRI